MKALMSDNVRILAETPAGRDVLRQIMQSKIGRMGQASHQSKNEEETSASKKDPHTLSLPTPPRR